MPTKETGHTAAVEVSASEVVRATHYAGIALSVLCFSLLGIYLRPLGDLSVLWFANAMLLGLFLHMPRLATPLGWGFAATGYVVADLLTGSGLLLSLARSSADLISVATAMAVLRRHNFIAKQGWKEPGGLPTLFLAIMVASLSAGITGGTLLWLLLANPLWLSITSWSVSELISYIIFLPCILSASKPNKWRWRKPRDIPPRKLIPLVILVASLLASALIGGPGALAFPVMALLACALMYGFFLTSLLTMATSMWLLITATSGSIHDTINAADVFLSIRLGVASIALAPIVVACVMAAREDNLRTLRHMAERDTLTDPLNRKTFCQSARKILSLLGEQGKTAALLMIDIDHFKRINDTHGHLVGDEVLRTTAERLRKSIRSDDLCARFGGEEFLVLIPDCTPTLLQHIAQRIHQTIGNEITLSNASQSLTLTGSIGGVLSNAALTDLEAMLLKADQALYASKGQGRNRTSLVYDI
ncbi:MAG TPA: diguanylate cyclase [Paenalcaligenes sp.]|nr:diguanylate cyclase [Paenalcaligenes sp.]